MDFKDVINQIEGLFEVVCIELFESLACNALRIQTDMNATEHGLKDVPIACISADSSEIELKAGLQVPVPVLISTYPGNNPVNDEQEERLVDWISELSNLLMGRLKAKLMAHKCEVSLGLPTTYFSADINDLMTGESKAKPILFEINGEVCAFHISIKIMGRELVFTADVDDSIDLLAEGEMELF